MRSPSVFYRVEYIFAAFSSCESVVDSPGCNFLCCLFPLLFWRFSLMADFWLPPFVLFPSFVNLPRFARVLLIFLWIDCTWVVIAPFVFVISAQHCLDRVSVNFAVFFICLNLNYQKKYFPSLLDLIHKNLWSWLEYLTHIKWKAGWFTA